MSLVSIITPLHNKGLYIAETIESVIAQTHVDWEMIIVENHSADDGAEIAERFAAEQSRVRLVRAPETVRGPGAARNLGLSHAKGEWILFLDADDLIESGYLEARLATASLDGTRQVVAGPWKLMFEDKPVPDTCEYPNGWKPQRTPAPDSIYAYSPWALHAALIRRDAMPPMPWLPELDQWPAEDNAFWFRILLDQQILWCRHAGAIYRKETANSRDQSSRVVIVTTSSIKAMLAANRRYLKGLGRNPSPGMAASAVRTLENLFQRAKDFPLLRGEIREQIARELADTSLLEPAMLARRLGLKRI